MSFRLLQSFQRIVSGRRVAGQLFAAILILMSAAIAQAASIRGVVTDASGSRVTGAAV
jgi:hypothetical protein